IRPLTNRSLGERIIAQGGAIIAEHATDEKFGPWSFLERNRLVAGISDAVLITEASAKSGTLNTAMHALEQGKDVFVVPGNITSPLSAGCNVLIKQGAHPVTCSDDILEILAPELLSAPAHQILTYNPTERLIIEQLQKGIRDGELIQRQTGLDAATLSTSLSMLEVNGTIRSLGANQWTVL
ncbi:MAG: DNA-processing protein DprA, partial [Candidatus Saccharimonas aalborgensis]